MPNAPPPTPDEIAEYEAKLAEYSTRLRGTRLDWALEWIAALVFAAVVLAAWFLCNSITLGFLLAIPLTALMVWGLHAIQRYRMRPCHEWLKANAHRFQRERD